MVKPSDASPISVVRRFLGKLRVLAATLFLLDLFIVDPFLFDELLLGTITVLLGIITVLLRQLA